MGLHRENRVEGTVNILPLLIIKEGKIEIYATELYKQQGVLIRKEDGEIYARLVLRLFTIRGRQIYTNLFSLFCQIIRTSINFMRSKS